MPSRQDQLHSHQFTVQRVVAALVMRDTDPAREPFRRGTTLASVLIAAILLGAVAAYGAIVGGGATQWRDAQAVIVEKESGARFVYRDGRLHPVPNYASALLVVGAAAKTVLVSRTSIESVPRGVPLGIADAPDSLPDAARLSGAPWTVCSTGGGRAPRSVLLVGATAAGGFDLGDDALLAQHPDGAVHLIWRNRRHPVRDRDLVFSALGWTDEEPVPVAPALLGALPAGADLARAPIPGEGEASVAVPDATVGEVFVVATQGGGRQYTVAHRGGLAVITQVQADLLLTDLDQSAPTELAQGDFADIPKVPGPSPPAPPPATTPALVAPDPGAVCGEVRNESGVAEVRVGAATPAGAEPVLVAPGRGALVASGGAIWVVTDLGRRHAMSAEVPAILGYGDVRPLRLPAAVVALVPAGSPLDPAAARSPAPR